MQKPTQSLHRFSKVGTKKSTIAAQSQNFRNSFGNQDFLDECQLAQAEKYLVKTFNSNATESTFDELRLELCKRTGSIFDLPCTSHSLRFGHVL